MDCKKILVFGAAGFIGTYLIDALAKKGYNVVATDINDIGKQYYQQNKIPYFEVDITKKEDFNRLPKDSFDSIIHLAAIQPANVSSKSYDPKKYIEVNVLGTLNILDFCKETHSKKIIYASSHRNTQGLWQDKQIISENDGHSIKYDGQYAMFSISETAAQDCVLHYMAEYGLRSIIFRLPPVYGYGPHTEIFMDGKPIKTGFQIFIDKAMKCEPLEVWGDWNKGRDIIYIKDVINAFVKAINNENAKGLYNITSGIKITLKEEAETIADVFWGDETTPQVVNIPEKPNGIDSFQYDIQKAKKELEWEPVFSFKDILIDFIKESQKKHLTTS
jgi:Nucleoside-diphosphate-sugar epimerases